MNHRNGKSNKKTIRKKIIATGFTGKGKQKKKEEDNKKNKTAIDE
jgi:hypothetical protein